MYPSQHKSLLLGKEAFYGLRMLSILSFALFASFFISCNSSADRSTALNADSNASTPPQEDVALSPEQEILAKAMEAHGGEPVLEERYEFDFRDKHYIYQMQAGTYQYERLFEDTLGQKIHDILSNDSFVRLINGDTAQITEERAKAYSNSINSVIYFTFLPFKLKDPAVLMQSLGTSEMEGQSYHKILVTFKREGGGKDYTDQYVYWFHQEKNTLDYLAYSYEVDEGGTRFRKAINPRMVGNMLFQDYINYAGEKETDVRTMDSLFQAGSLKELSRIENVNIQKVDPS